jgi:hypothetical protein
MRCDTQKMRDEIHHHPVAIKRICFHHLSRVIGAPTDSSLFRLKLGLQFVESAKFGRDGLSIWHSGKKFFKVTQNIELSLGRVAIRSAEPSMGFPDRSRRSANPHQNWAKPFRETADVVASARALAAIAPPFRIARRDTRDDSLPVAEPETFAAIDPHCG